MMKCQRGAQKGEGQEKELQLELELVHPLRDKPYRASGLATFYFDSHYD